MSKLVYRVKGKNIIKKMNTLIYAFDFYGVSLNYLGYDHETKVFTLHNGEIELTRNNANKFIRKYKADKARYVNNKILERA